jgi:hypothetical protein
MLSAGMPRYPAHPAHLLLHPDDASHGNTTPITKAVFATDKLEALGWKPITLLKDGLAHTIQALQ